ncbi:hypothetical protein JRI60_38875 [Archangium violaceum]|uniref:hypothetical protein n=1 Tax=Archangium violaceum TaxID=83451 RepID=UPI00195276C4|nr:hypothetical protein [Archangium violaceum]QRN95011.1 hypothetical protein JRI60_38875 [Archangium violaceum]
MKPPAPPALAALLLLWGCVASAAEWRGASPGVTPLPEVLRTFGKPSRHDSVRGEIVLTYATRTAPNGTRLVRFRFDPDDGLLRHIDVFPKRPPTRAELEKQFGPSCESGSGPEDPCYELEILPGNRFSFRYTTLGVQVLFERKRVKSLSYSVPSRPSPPPPAQPPPETVAKAQPEPEPEPEDTSPAPVSDPAPVAAPPPSSSSIELAPAIVEPEPSTSSSADALIQPAVIAPPGEDTATAPEPEEAIARKDDAPSFQDLLSLGGTYLQRAELSGSRGGQGTVMQPVLPALVDVYLDAKPSENVRSFVRGRLLYDPLDRALSTPTIQLDQLWVRFGIADHVFITAGRQQLKWGSSKVWNPTDFLRQPNPLPLDTFDLRTGVDMLKVNIPWEAMASNLWLIATADLRGPESQPIRYGGAARAEMVLGPSELSLTAVFQQGRRPRYGVDWSIGLERIDLNAEVALVRDSSTPLWEHTGTDFVPRTLGEPKVLASGGIATSFRFADIYRVNPRLEVFYNQLGTDDRALLTWLRSTNDFQPLYFGRFYGMAQIAIARRSILEPTLLLTLLANVRDDSYLSRVDFNLLPLRDVYVQAFLEAPFGARGSEFRFVPDPSVAELPATGLPLLRAGLSIRIKM